MKWYEVIFMIIITILLSPFIIIVLLFLLIASPFIAINNRIVYKKSPYYKEFKIPYNKNILRVEVKQSFIDSLNKHESKREIIEDWHYD